MRIMQNNRLPLYIQIQDYFKNMISTNQLKDNDKIPSEKELMEQFNVSRITVANALTQLAKDGWIYRIPGRGSFVQGKLEGLTTRLPPFDGGPEINGNGVLIGETNSLQHHKIGRRMIGFIIPTLEDFFAIRMIKGINSILSGSDYYLTIVLTNQSIEREKEAIRELINKGASGLIIFPTDAETYNDEILALKIHNYPFILVDRYLPGVETNFVRSDSISGAELAVNHLWDLGHRDIAICSDSPLPTVTVEDRISGYMEALKKKGANINPALILTEFEVDYSSINHKHPLYRFIKSRMATAYISLNTKIGLHISSIIRHLGLQIPEDASFLTFDDPTSGFEEFGSYTYIDQSEEEIGREATSILINILEKPQQENKKYSKVILKPRLVVRQTTGQNRN